ncbi:hypothetical protein [Lactococcus garvieae]
MPARLIDLTGQKFGKLKVISRAENRGKQVMWYCQCSCGNKTIVRANHLRSGATKSCGCLEKENRFKMNLKHGGAKGKGCQERLYGVWLGMRKRCFNPNEPAFPNYGGRGITICDEWSDYSIFRKWALANGYDKDAPLGKCTIDRINNDGNYEPSNCRWVDMKVQRNNQRILYE